MTSDYYSFDDILAEQQRVPCFFNDEVPMYGFLENSHDQDLHAGVRVELPFWLAEPLALNEFVELELPKCFGNKTKEDLRADPKYVDLNQICPYFYKFGTKMVNLIVDEQLPRIISDAFRIRLQMIMDLFTSKVGTDSNRFYMGLDETEKNLHKIGYKSEKELTKWTKGQGFRLEASPFLIKKRLAMN